MKITVHIEDCSEDDLRRLFGHVATASRQKQGVSEERVAEIAAIPDENIDTSEIPEQGDEFFDRAAEGGGSDTSEEQPEADSKRGEDLVAQYDGNRKRTKTVTLAEGVQGKEEDAVHTKDGEIGIIAATYRGIAVVEFEDGRQEAFEGKELTFRPEEQEEASAAPEQQQEPEPSKAPPAKEEKKKEPSKPQQTNGEAVTADKLRDMARTVLAAKGAAATQRIVREATENKAKKVSEVPPEMLNTVYEALRGALN